MFRILRFSVLIMAFLQSCRGVKTLPSDHTAFQERERPHMLAIFMDGTRDKPHTKEWRNSHIKTIHSLAFPGIRSLYVEGVGAGNRLAQAARAHTTNDRILKAYRFLTEHYQPGDSICLFGFSRGANQCRILSGFIYSTGIIDLKKIKKESDKQQLLFDLYEVYLDTVGAPGKKIKMAQFINQWNRLRTGEEVAYDTSGRTMIELLALWDTVEAFEVKDRRETTTPLPEHLNQLYNVKKLIHAVSLDDNRAFNYTPVLATHKDVSLRPYQDLNAIVEEVWFNGSHKDVGGGVRNRKRAQLTGISLKWMLSRLKPYHLFRDTMPRINTFGKVNDMRGNRFLRLLSPGDTLRGIDKYWASMNPAWNDHRIKVHRSIIDRLAAGAVQEFKMKNGRLDWYDWEPFNKCFVKEGRKRILRKDCSCIEVVDD